ncbi:MAG: permease [Thermotoga caldifontis]|uniref:permease n=1 Tax=Thermotoga caldifontis TaxID=1508419 RepID=UPI003C7B4E76
MKLSLLGHFIPLVYGRFTTAVMGSLHMHQKYARLHALTYLVFAFFITCVIANFVSQAASMEYLKYRAKRLSYVVASLSGTILAVCSLHDPCVS